MASSSPSPSQSPPVETDVLIVGAGPVGLVLAYQLARFSHPTPTNPDTTPIRTHIIETHAKPVQQTFGRAVTFWSRSMEILHSLGLADDILQQCVAVRGSAAYDAAGNEVFGRGWSFLEGISDTRFTFASVLRQRFVEDLVRARLARYGVGVHEGHRFAGLEVDESVPVGEIGRVKARIVEAGSEGRPEREYVVHARYLLGCDGSRTAVRGAAGIASDGDRTEDQWVRIDGVLKHTTMPKPRCYGAIESPVYGNVLWIPLDHGATRLGFAMRADRRELYGAGALDEAAFVAEAKLSVAPFEIEWERVDWASVYSVGQRVARTFWAHESVFIAGDAAHSHSSGAGQGMNTGMHDAVNLGWKLAGVLAGWLKRDVLATYDAERQPNSAKLIQYDEDISVLVSGRLPKSYAGDRADDPNVVLGRILQHAKGFNTGLTIGFEPNLAVWKNDTGCEDVDKNVIPAPAVPGYRAPDVKVLTTALWDRVWLHDLMSNVARFTVLIFAGRSQRAREQYAALKTAIQAQPNMKEPAKDTLAPIFGAGAGGNGAKSQAQHALTNGDGGHSKAARQWPVNFLTVLPEKVGNAWFELGYEPLGRVYYDDEAEAANTRYGVDMEKGAVFVVRPDLWIGAKFALEAEASLEGVVGYLGGLLHV